ncbi:PREDICTED: transmembrane protein 62-like [Ceratosolen solmsi marchali]|uniref:Transmembrane protein 62-like n=1 Tax=Ceratosolen solmsi marchali TaxID=326594 RepID=A0AAJ7DW43_9HYME|nr:PREDICTED: transmembrane protein 62-like [Ceratosolen solmsi marchali]
MRLKLEKANRRYMVICKLSQIQEMKITKLTLSILMFVLMLSIFVANVANIIDVDSHTLDKVKDIEDVTKLKSRWFEPKKFEIHDSYEHLVWFLQITDLHISIFQDPLRITEFKEFCDITVGSINPEVVLASGDLTDAKTVDKMGSRQYLEEWKQYKKVLDDSKVAEKTTWLDVRGNHDNFNIFDTNSKDNYYTNYSMQGRKHPRSYMHQVHLGLDKYTFIAVDACLKPGPKRPFNFVGALDNLEIDRLESLMNESRSSQADYIIWFGHYPTSCIVAPNDGGIRMIIGKYEESLTYLCGHFHTLAGVVPNMYTLQKTGFLELELADWKDNRMYRLGVIDHGQFSFTDIEHRDWPVALVTNPKNAQFAMPHKENIESIIHSTHIRALAFSIVDIKSVKVRINDKNWITCVRIKGPLYVAKWNPLNYSTGIHYIQLQVTDIDGRMKIVTQAFSLDGSRLSFGILSRIVLMSNVSRIFQFLFATLFILLIIPLCSLRIYHNTYRSVYDKNRGVPRINCKLFHWWLRGHWILSTVDRLFFPLVLYAAYLIVGPWTIGEIIDNHTGVIFAWGTFIGSSFLPGSFTYAYGFFQLLSFHLPLTLIIAHRVSQRLHLIEKPPIKSAALLLRLCEHFPFVLLVTLQATMIYFFWLAYGTVATIFCPLRTWSLFLAILLWYQVYQMPTKCLRSAAKVWCTHGELVSKVKDDDQYNNSK